MTWVTECRIANDDTSWDFPAPEKFLDNFVMETVGRYGASYGVVVLVMNFRGSCGNLFDCRGCCVEESTPTILQAAGTRMSPQSHLLQINNLNEAVPRNYCQSQCLLCLVLSTCERRRCAIRTTMKRSTNP